ncbi:hypothetical protein [Methylobacterium sp. J-070]|uniref:hypothetical protein n=1 Tax=Methylobacterium sp. J-070 TaxID=2836650 RepID=UPI001FBBF75F|nr:hypothetical protein [Methylobacterium sp. J-070]MCJ2054909.1 hypothetical protein [Methylobacterium sp. J-070]
MLLAPVPWARQVWALPLLTAMVPSECDCRERGRPYKPLLDVGRHLALQARHWLPSGDLILVGDSGLSALLFLDAMHRSGITAITRSRLHAACGNLRACPSTAIPGDHTGIQFDWNGNDGKDEVCGAGWAKLQAVASHPHWAGLHGRGEMPFFARL